MYKINYHTGAGNDAVRTLGQAMDIADKNARYTTEPISIEDDGGDIVAVRQWWGSMDGIADCHSPIQFGANGFYGDWEEIV